MTNTILFLPGTVVATPAAGRVLDDIASGAGGSTGGYNTTVHELLYRHLTGDWGDLSEHDRRLNDAAVKGGDRIFSAYDLDVGKRLYVITEADRSVTTILTPGDY